MEEIEITKEQAMLKGFYENLCMYFSDTYFSNKINGYPGRYVTDEEAQIAWDGFRSCIDHIAAKAVFPLEECQLMKIDESTIEGMLKEQLCYKLARFFMNNLDESTFFSKETDSNGRIYISINFNFINPERLKEVNYEINKKAGGAFNAIRERYDDNSCTSMG